MSIADYYDQSKFVIVPFDPDLPDEYDTEQSDKEFSVFSDRIDFNEFDFLDQPFEKGLADYVFLKSLIHVTDQIVSEVQTND